jgi:hypothetical protein
MRPTLIISAAGGVAVLLTAGSPTWAQANRTFVSGLGSDANACTRSAPCRTFAKALTQTNAGGEITILDPAGYGAVAITKSISIINDGVGDAGVTVTAGNAININTGASDVVNLRGLTLVGDGVGLNGIDFSNLGTLNMQNCVIRGFTNNGLSLSPAGVAVFNISDTVVSNNSNTNSNIVTNAVQLLPVFGGQGITTVSATFDRMQAIGSSVGFAISGADMNSFGFINVTIANSTVSHNGGNIGTGSGPTGAGISTTTVPSTAQIRLMVANSIVANNGTGITESGAGTEIIYLTRNAISGNDVAYNQVDPSTMFSFGDNDIKGNGEDGSGIQKVSAQ